MAERDWVTIIEPSEDELQDASFGFKHATPSVRRCKIPFGWLYQVGKWNGGGEEPVWGEAVFVPEGNTDN